MERLPPDPIYVLRGSKYAVNTAKFFSHNDNGFLISGCAAGEVRLWSLSNRRSEVILTGHHGEGILAVHPLKNSGILSHGRDNRINTWHLGDGRNDITSSMEVASMSLCKSAIVSQDRGSHFIAVVGLDKSEVRVCDLENKQVTHRLIPSPAHKALGMPMCLKFMDSKQLLVAYEDGSILVWNLETNKVVTEKSVHSEPVMCMDYSMTAQKGVSGSAEDKLASWRIEEDNFEVLQKVELTNPGLSDVCIRNDDKIVATAGWDHRIRLYGFKKLKPLAILTYHKDSVHCVDFSPPLPQFQNQHLLAAGSKDKHISIWSVYESPSR